MVSRNEGNGDSQLPSSKYKKLDAIDSVCVSDGDAEVQPISLSINLGYDCQNISCGASLKKEVSISFIVFLLNILYYN